MAITLRSVGSITGMDVSVSRSGQIYTATASEAGVEIVRGEGRTEKEALGRLAAANYKRVSAKVMERAGWKCEDCSRLVPLQVHHRQFRSHGRLDNPGNLMAICSDCHRMRHGG